MSERIEVVTADKELRRKASDVHKNVKLINPVKWCAAHALSALQMHCRCTADAHCGCAALRAALLLHAYARTHPCIQRRLSLGSAGPSRCSAVQ